MICFLQPIPNFSHRCCSRSREDPVGSKGRVGRGDRVECRLLSISPCLVLLVSAAVPFSALWDGAGNAGAALLQTECSINRPLGPAVPCWGANHPRHPTLNSFSRAWVQVHPLQRLWDLLKSLPRERPRPAGVLFHLGTVSGKCAGSGPVL